MSHKEAVKCFHTGSEAGAGSTRVSWSCYDDLLHLVLSQQTNLTDLSSIPAM